MVGFDFPTNPPLGTITTTPDGAARSWDGVKWVSAHGGPFLPLAGGTMEGPINLAAPPVSPAQAASKAYVDSLVGTGGGGTADYRIIDLAGLLGADPSSGVDATAAMQTALTMAATTPGSIIYLCPGDWNFQSAVPVGPGTNPAINACFLVPSRTILRGAGMGQTRLFWNDNASPGFNLFDAVQVTAGTPHTTDIGFEDLTIVGSWDVNLEGTGLPGFYPLLFHNVYKMRFLRIGSRFCRRNAIVTRGCTDIVCHECDIRYCAHGAIDHSTCSMVIVSNCTIMHSDDNCIAVHSENFDDWGVRKNVIITGNNIFDSVGISCVAPRSVIIANNNLDCIRFEGIALHEFTAPGVASNSAALGTIVANNNITNMINEWLFSGPPQVRNGNAAITLSGYSARAGNLPAIPGENVTNTTTIEGVVFPAGSIIDDTVYYQTNNTSASVAVALSRGYLITGNHCARTLPPCDGTATAIVGSTTKTYTKWSDYGDNDPVGLGRMFLRTGWVNPSLSVGQMSGTGVQVGGGDIRDVMITNNQFRGLDSAVFFYLCRPKDVFVRNNVIVDCGTGFGAIIVNLDSSVVNPDTFNPLTPCRIYVEDNFIDVDPYQRHSNRLPKGQWNTSVRPQWPGALWIQAGSGVVFRRNTVRNTNLILGNIPGGVTQISDNWVEAFPALSVPGANAGIGSIPLDGVRLRHIESDPTSTRYGELMSAPLDTSIGMPTTGLYLVGDYVGRSYTGPDANGAVLRGWVRLTTGNTHVAGVDWTPVYDYNTSNDLTALPVVGASNGIVTSIVVNQPPGAFQFAISDPWPGVAIDAPGSGGTQATAHVPALLPEIPGTIDTTTMGSDHNLGLVPLIAAQGLSYVVGETLTATGGTFTVPFSGTVDSIGSAGGVQRFVQTQGGKYSAFPPDPTNFSGTAGAGFALHLQTWALGAPLIVDNGGHYPNGTPNAVLTQTNGDRGGHLTVKMGQSFVGSPTGLMLAGNATAPLQAVPLQQLTSAVTGSVVSFNTRTGAVTLTSGDVLAVQPASTITPTMDGTAAVGSNATSWARADHVHPSDISRVATSGGTLTGGTLAGTTTNGGVIQGGILNSPTLTGLPTAPTAAPGTNTTQLATTAFAAAAAAAAGVQTFNTRSGAVTLSNGDVIAVLPGSSTAPLMNSVAAVGTLGTWAHADHVHASDTSRFAVSGGTITGAVTITSGGLNALSGNLTAGGGSLIADGPNTINRRVVWSTNGLTRWLAIANAVTESGANVGSDFQIVPYQDDGTTSGAAALTIKRSSGLATFAGGVSLGNVYGASTIDLSKHVQLLSGYGFNVTSGRINYVAGGWHVFVQGTTDIASVTATGLTVLAGNLTVGGTGAVQLSGSGTYSLRFTAVDGASLTANNFALMSFNGIGFASGINAQAIPNGLYGMSYDARAGNMTLAGRIFAPGNAATSQLQNIQFARSGTDQQVQLTANTATPTLASIAAGGTGWAVNDRAYDASGNFFTITAVDGTTAATTVTLDTSMARGSPAPTNPVALTAAPTPVSTGTGLTVNLTWTVPARLVIQHTAGSILLNSSGGTTIQGTLTTTGFVTLNADPTANLHAATKQYVDNSTVDYVRIGTDVGFDLNSIGGGFVGVHSIFPQTAPVNFPANSGGTVITGQANNSLWQSQLFMGVTTGVLQAPLFFRFGTGASTYSAWQRVITDTSALFAGAIAVPVKSVTATAYTVLITDATLLLAPTGACVLTLLNAAAIAGRYLRLKLTAAFAVTSATNNIVPLAGGAATNAILPATAGKFALLQSDGTNWQIMEAN